MEIWSVVVAGGSGTRFGRPKQLADLAGRRVIDWSIAAVQTASTGVVVVGSDELGDPASLGVSAVVVGGATRSDSVRCGLDALPDDATHVLIHDAARPLVPAEVVGRVVEALDAGADAVVPVVPVTDTLRTATGNAADRDEFVAVQTPQGFRLSVLQQAHSSGTVASDDATVVEQAGGTVVHVDGAPENLKITFPHDLLVAESLSKASS